MYVLYGTSFFFVSFSLFLPPFCQNCVQHKRLKIPYLRYFYFPFLYVFFSLLCISSVPHCNDYIFINLYHIPPISSNTDILRYLYCTVQLFPLDPFFCDFLSFECNLLTLFKCSFNEVTPTCAINSGNKSFRITL